MEQNRLRSTSQDSAAIDATPPKDPDAIAVSS
jgi:hypothetical protein